jgi:hypothetical protein
MTEKEMPLFAYTPKPMLLGFGHAWLMHVHYFCSLLWAALG